MADEFNVVEGQWWAKAKEGEVAVHSFLRQPPCLYEASKLRQNGYSNCVKQDLV
jgi:hypothetical protein